MSDTTYGDEIMENGRFVEVEVDEEDVEPEDSPFSLPSGIMSVEKRKEAVEFLLSDAKAALAEWEEDREQWKKWRRQFKARPASKVKNTPYPNASNTYVPVLRSITQTLYGKLVDMFEARDPFYEAEPLNKESDEDRRRAEVTTKYFNMLYESKHDLNGRKHANTLLREAALMGLSLLKIPYIEETWSFKTNDAVPEKITSTSHNGPAFVVIPREDFLYRKSSHDIERMPWFAHILHWNWTDLQKKKSTYSNISKIEDYGRDPNDAEWPEVLVEGEEGEHVGGAGGSKGNIWDIGEFHYWCDADDDGELEDVVLLIDLGTGTVLSEKYNDLGVRPFIPFLFLDDSFKLAGEGTGDSVSIQDEEATQVNNLKNDNMKIVNMRVIIAKKRGVIGPRERLYPGKILFADNPKDDVQSMQLGEIYPSADKAIQDAVMWGQRATGISDAMAGFADGTVKSGGTFRGQNQRLQQGQGIFTSISKTMVRSFSDSAMIIFYQLVRNRDKVIEKERKIRRLSEEELNILDQVLDMDLNDLPITMNFSIKTTDVEDTFESKRQNHLTLSQLYAQFSQQSIPLAQQVLGPQGKALQQQAPDLYQYMLSILLGGAKLMGDIFKFFNEDDVDKYVPQTKKQEAMLELLESLQTQAADQIGQQAEQLKAMMGGGQAGPGPEVSGEAMAQEFARQEQEMPGGGPGQGGMNG